MKKLSCPKCFGLSVKSGFQNNIQRYKCKCCGKRFQLNYIYNAFKPNTNALIKSLLKEGCGVRSIARILKISCGTVLSRILKISKEIEPPVFQKPYCSYEVDELWSFVGNKKNVIWITYAIERETSKVIDLYVGSKSKLTIKPLVDKLLSLQPKKIYTDRLNIYPNLIPKKIHQVFKYCTNKIERMNLTLRAHIKRLSRRTICFSRNKQYLEAHLRIYFWG
ncbi:IS1 family transposase [Flavobacteriaceae bacterium M23B6Z8]